jgi:trehalose 6-phosphate phosphatase
MNAMADLASPPATLPAPPAIDPGRDALFLDFDGTLADIAPTPDAARLAPGMADAIARWRDRLLGRVAIISGRSIALLEELVPIPGLALAGVHGLELRHADGRLEQPSPAPGLATARERLAALAAREPGLLIEDKGLSVAIHYRAVPGLAPIAHARAHALADQLGLRVQTGKMVIELRPPGADKGTALRRLLAVPPFRGFRPLFAGDDDTDEVAFREVREQGGTGIRVGTPARGTAASHGLPDVTAVRHWLEQGA